MFKENKMNKFLHAFPFILFCFFSSSCKKNSGEVQSGACILLSAGAGVRYEYDSARRLTKSIFYNLSGNMERYSLIEYNNKNQIVTITEFAVNQASPTTLKEYEYSGDNRIIVVKEFWSGNVLGRTYNLEVNEKGQLVKRQYPDGSYYRREYNKNGNIVRLYRKANSARAEYMAVFYSKYDDKISPNSSSPSLQLFLTLFYESLEHRNNILVEEIYNEDGSIAAKNTYAYEYNEQGYAKKRIDAVTGVTEYKYDCQ